MNTSCISYTPEWAKSDFNDSKWDGAIPVIAEENPLWNAPQSQSRFFPWVNLLLSECDPLRYTRRFPSSVFQYGEVLQQCFESSEDTAVRMSLEPILPLEKTSIENIDSLTGKQKGPVVVNNSEITEPEEAFDGLRNATIVLDFGRLMNARLGFCLDSSAGTVIDIGYAYRLDRKRVVPYISSRTPMASQYTTCDGLQRWQTFQWYHFRYVQFTFRNLIKPLKVFEIWAEEVEYPFVPRGHFECNNAIVNYAFDASRRTVKLCTVDRVMDNPSRERKQYIGDGSGILSAILACFGNETIIRKYFVQADEGQYSTGLYRCAYPGRDYDKEPIFDHSLAIPLRLYEYDLLFDDINLLDRMWPGLLRFLRLLESSISKDGIVKSVPYSIWFDWAHIERRGWSFLVNAMIGEGLRRSALIATRLGEDRYAQIWNDLAQTMCGELREKWYDQKKGVFVDSIIDGAPCQHMSEHAISLAILFDIATPEQVLSIIEVYSKNYNSFGQASPLWPYIPTCFIRAGRTDLAMEWIARRFGPLLENGCQTVPETWCLFGEKTTGVWRARNSRAVAQGCGLGVPWTLLTELCGIQSLKPGFKIVRFCPQPGSITRLEGIFPGPDGSYQLNYQQNARSYNIEIKVPFKRTIILDLPFVEPERRIIVNNNETDPTGTIKMPNGQLAPRFQLSGQSQFDIKIIR